jgi:acyl-coenzyme A synthetase/AMP-(fatty) acid ligase
MLESIKVTALNSQGEITDIGLSDLPTSRPNHAWAIHDGTNRSEAILAVREVLEGKNYLFVSKKTNPKIVLKLIEYLSREYKSSSGLMVFLSSGSTGDPKIVIHSLETLFESAQKIVQAYPEITHKRFYHVFPTTYVAGILNCILVPVVASGSIFLDREFNFTSAFSFAKNIQLSHSEIAWLSPAMIASIIAASRHIKLKHGNLSLVLSATGPLTNEIRQKGEVTFECPILNTYGTSELLFISGERSSDDVVTLGEPFVGVELNNIQTLEMYQSFPVSELLVRSNTKALSVMNLSLNSEEFVPERSTFSDWVHTRDLVHFVNGKPAPVGRIDDIIVLGGLNISLSQIESVANSFPGVLDSCAKADFGGTSTNLRLLYELEYGVTNFRQDRFRSHLQSQLSLESTPRKIQEVFFVRTSNGKLQKSKIRAGEEGFLPK